MASSVHGDSALTARVTIPFDRKMQLMQDTHWVLLEKSMKVTLNMLFKMYGKSYSVYFHPVDSCKQPNINNSHLVALCTIIQIPSNPFLVGLAASAMLAVNILIFSCIPHDNSQNRRDFCEDDHGLGSQIHWLRWCVCHPGRFYLIFFLQKERN